MHGGSVWIEKGEEEEIGKMSKANYSAVLELVPCKYIYLKHYSLMS